MSISVLFVHGGGEGAFAEDTKLVESLQLDFIHFRPHSIKDPQGHAKHQQK